MGYVQNIIFFSKMALADNKMFSPKKKVSGSFAKNIITKEH